MIDIDLCNPSAIPIKMREDGATFELLTSVRINIGNTSSAVWVVIPQGYVTDFTTVPPELSLLGFDKLGKHSYASLLHDWMYTQQYGYELSNAIFYEALRRSSVPNWKAAVMAFFTQAGGKGRYKKCTKEMAIRMAALPKAVAAPTPPPVMPTPTVAPNVPR